jgi:hypothetical protein
MYVPGSPDYSECLHDEDLIIKYYIYILKCTGEKNRSDRE